MKGTRGRRKVVYCHLFQQSLHKKNYMQIFKLGFVKRRTYSVWWLVAGRLANKLSFLCQFPEAVPTDTF